MSPHQSQKLLELGHTSIRALESERGILASGRDEVYGCIFGRDSCIVALMLMRAHEKREDAYVLSLVRKILVNLAELQGREVNIESGEEPGKIIHEFRPDKHEHLTKDGIGGEPAWYLYPDAVMRNFDSIDSTPLFLMACYAYFRASGDEQFVESLLPSIEAALRWLLEYADSNNDGLVDYSFHPDRTYGGLKTQSWMDSVESVFFEHSDERPSYPIAPVEAQAYAYAALRDWAEYFAERDTVFTHELHGRADALKRAFNEQFLIRSARGMSVAFAVEGRGRQLTSARSSMGHCLFAAHVRADGTLDSVLEPEDVSRVVERLLQPDLYVKSAGLRTLSSRSKRFDANSYHNGSIWPHDTALVAEGFEQFGFKDAALRMRRSLARAYMHFDTPIELFTYTNRSFGYYEGPGGQGACKTQAWSAASLLSML